MYDDMYNELKLFMMKKISEKYNTLASIGGKCFGEKGIRYLYRAVIDSFMGGDFTYERKKINRHKGEHPNFADYNYFDLDTLVAYYKFLDILFEEIQAESERRRRNFTTADDINVALYKTSEYMIRNKRTEDSGYYKGYAVLETDRYGRLSPLKTNNNKVKNKIAYYLSALEEYFNDKYPPRVNEVEKERQTPPEEKYEDEQIRIEVVEREARGHAREEEIAREKMTKKVNKAEVSTRGLKKEIHEVLGKKIEFVVTEEWFFDYNGNPIRRIVGECEYGVLYKCTDMDGWVYEGPLYDGEGNEVLLAEESGEIFYPNENFNEIKKKKSTIKKEIQEEAPANPEEPPTAKTKYGEQYMIK